ncbi:MAG: 1-acyl-sn-glycerol-3-phosphate acyltransferase [Propionibacteriaceae bacterium]|nr:1-acyl-sn-glycerol-3-phosphate acyltransferase [Propionibacteriaceae bacterium]
MRRRTITVSDEHEDDFGVASRHVNQRVVDETYPYIRRNPLWRLASALLYYVVGPIPVWLISKMYGMKIVNRSAIRKAGGCYAYANHTHWTDVLIPYLLAFPKRAYVVAGPTAVSVPVAKHLVPMVGGIPLNETVTGKAHFRQALDRAVKRGGVVAIFPEAHVWPYFNGIRDFSPASFTYPVRCSSPVVGYVVTYRPRRWLTMRPPRPTVTVGEPIMPETWANQPDPKQVLRDKVYQFMSQTARTKKSYAWVHYTTPDGPAPGHTSISG